MRSSLGIVIGDPGGIGPEVCVKALATREPQSTVDIVLIGSYAAVARAAQAAGTDLEFVPVATLPPAGVANGHAIPVLDREPLSASAFPLGAPTKVAGKATYDWMCEGVALAEEGAIAGLIIAPIDMTSFKLADVDVEHFFEPENVLVLRTTGKLRTVPIAEHVLIRNVPPMVTTDRVLKVITTIADQLRTWGTPSPKIAVAGLNPHCAGEEDSEQIAPAVAAAKAQGIDASGPYSPDTIFRRGVTGDFDVIITMYHDQGQIATKTIGLESACSIFVGVPYVRVGIPHGSAMDIATQNIAHPGTALGAMNTAARLINGGGI